jgi:hypothetical protein
VEDYCNGTQMEYVLHLNFQDLVENGNAKKGIRPVDVKRLIQVAEELLPPRMGEAYTKVVVACLTVAEGGIVNLENFEMPDEGRLTEAYISHIVFKIGGIESLALV